jgi:hypothetical protein
MSEAAVRAALQPSLRREQHILIAAATIAVSISVAAVHSSAAVPVIVTWFAGCAGMAALGRFWYRSRVRACDRLVAALDGGAVATKIVIARFTINYVIPFGYLTSFDVGATKNVTFGFWTRAAANRFAATLGGASDGALPAARVVR